MQQIETTIERLGPVADATLRAPSIDPFDAVVAPGDVFRHPREVLTYPGLTTAEKRIILASWASDARAVESCPTLRCLPGSRAEPVPLDAVLAALQVLDEGPIDRPEARGEPRLPFTVGSRGNREAASWRNGFH
ncbi:hypothetical protein D8770_28265 [Methylobacterium sp. DB1607]|nr:hypothetical protein [Methylobacterium sp. DB1607]